jgi:anti-sigma B factor antagonist
MNIREKKVSDVVIISFDGSLMGGPEAVSINESINRYLDENSLKLVINMENVKRINSSGLGILIKALTTFKNNGGELKLANVKPNVNNLLVMTKLNTILETYSSEEAAIESFQ